MNDEYKPTIRLEMGVLINAWLQGMHWPNGDKITIKDFRWDVTHDTKAVFVQPRCEPATPEQLIPHGD